MKTLHVKLDDWTHKNLKALAAIKETTIAEVLKMLIGKEIQENPEECKLCLKYGKEPNKTTQAAMVQEEAKSFESIDNLMEDLESD
jgi:hypothetical protein